MNLHQYLLAIKDNKAINLTRFIALLPAEYQQHWRNVFSAMKTVSKNKYVLSVIDDVIFKQLLQSTMPSSNRVDAAKQGDSHQYNTSMSFLLVYPNIDIQHSVANSSDINSQTPVNNQRKPPVVVVSDRTGFTMDFKNQKTLIIIENQENFFRYNAFLPKLLDIDTRVDIAFGQGNSATNSLNASFFSQYNQILCCFDYDLGGLTMFSSLTNLLAGKKVNFILPSTTCLHDDNFINSHFKKAPKEIEHWHKAIALAEQFGFADLAQAFTRSKKFMEQEVFLSEPVQHR